MLSKKYLYRTKEDSWVRPWLLGRPDGDKKPFWAWPTGDSLSIATIFPSPARLTGPDSTSLCFKLCGPKTRQTGAFLWLKKTRFLVPRPHITISNNYDPTPPLHTLFVPATRIFYFNHAVFSIYASLFCVVRMKSFRCIPVRVFSEPYLARVVLSTDCGLTQRTTNDIIVGARRGHSEVQDSIVYE